jgi:hypothetical protein
MFEFIFKQLKLSFKLNFQVIENKSSSNQLNRTRLFFTNLTSKPFEMTELPFFLNKIFKHTFLDYLLLVYLKFRLLRRT